MVVQNQMAWFGVRAVHLLCCKLAKPPQVPLASVLFKQFVGTMWLNDVVKRVLERAVGECEAQPG